MQAREFMTKDPITVSGDTPTPEIARLLLAHGISAAPVVADGGIPIGMISEGGLLGRDEADRQARRDWWLTLLAEDEALHPEFLATLRNPQLTAREVMSAPGHRRCRRLYGDLAAACACDIGGAIAIGEQSVRRRHAISVELADVTSRLK